MSEALDLDEVKAIIRGLIVSSAAATSLRQLELDYKKQEGSTLPFKEFGHPSAESFLRSIPDTVYLRQTSYGCSSTNLIVEPIQSEKSEHVEKMVTRQKNSKPLRSMKRYSALKEPQRQRPRVDSSKLSELAPRFIPLSLRNSLSRVCQRYAPNGLPLSSLGIELSRDLSMAGWVEGGKSGWLNTNGFSSLQEVIDGIKDQGLIRVSIRNGQEWVTSCIHTELDRHKTSEQLPSPKNQESPNGFMVPDDPETWSDDEWSSDVKVCVSDRMKENFREILVKHPNGLWCSELPREYKIHTGCDIDVKQIGFPSIVQMASRLKDVFICTRPDTSSDWLLFDSHSNALWNCPAAPIGKGNRMPFLPQKYVRNIETLLDDHPNGIEKVKFLGAYKAKYKEDLPLNKHGFENEMDLLAHLARQNAVHLKFSGYLPMVFKQRSSSSPESVFGGLRKDGEFINALYPLGVVEYGDEIPIQSLPEDLEPGCSFDVQVSEVESPSKFWFQLWEIAIQNELEKMMDELQEFYNNDGVSFYRMSDAAIMVGHYCTAKYPVTSNSFSEWHRAIITSLPSPSEVEVFYVDYGTSQRIQRSEIYYLEKRFSILPVQAHLARLTNIRPVGYGLWKKLKAQPLTEEISNIKPTWHKDCLSYFVELIGNRPTVAVVTRIRKSDSCLSLGLTDTSGKDDKHINDMFVVAKLAEFGEMTDDEDDPPNRGSLRNTMEHPAHVRDSKCLSHWETPAPVVSPEGSPSSLPSEKLITAENGHLNSGLNETSSIVPPYSSTPPNNLNEKLIRKGLDGGQSMEDYLREQLKESAKGEGRKVRQNKLLEEWKRLEEWERLEEQKRLEILRRLGEQRWLEERKLLEEKAKCEAQLQLEIQRLQIQQKLLDLQQQQYRTQLLLLSTQNGLTGTGVTPGFNSLLGTQITFPPAPEMMNMASLANIQQGFPQVVNSVTKDKSLTPEITSTHLNMTLGVENFPFQNQAFPPWNNFGSCFGKPLCDFLRADNLTGNPNMYTPPGFINFPNSLPPRQAPTCVTGAPTFGPPGLVISGSVSNESGSFAEKPDGGLMVSKEPTKIAENCPNTTFVSAAICDSLIMTHDSNSMKDESPASFFNISNTSSHPNNTENLGEPANISDTVISQSQNDVFVDNFVNFTKRGISHPYGLEISPAQASFSATKINDPKIAYSSSKTNAIRSPDLSELSTFLGSCNLSSSGNEDPSPAVRENTSNKDLQVEEKKSECISREKWKMKILPLSSEDEGTDFMKGCMNGKTFVVINMNGVNCVLTEQIMGLFYNNLPVHVALKIAALKPNGFKIKSFILDSQKNKRLCKGIERFNVIEVNPHSDIHLITLESLHYLCSALGDPSL